MVLCTATWAGKPSRADEPVQTILTTDFSMDYDVDDWFDTLIFATLPELNPVGLVLEHYATDQVEAKVHELLAASGVKNLKIVRGVQKPLHREGDKLVASQYHDGAKLIIDVMRNAPGNVCIIAVGSLRNEALAYSTDPELFRRKIKALYFVGGTVAGCRDCNVSRDTLAAEIIINSPVPKVWIPCTPSHLQKFTGDDETLLRKMTHPTINILVNGIDVWRANRERLSPGFLERTGQTPKQGKNLWSIPAFLKAAGQGVEWMTFVRGKMHANTKQWVPGGSLGQPLSNEEMGSATGKWTWFERDPNGPDLMLEKRSQRPMCKWVLGRLAGYSDRRKHR